MQCVLVYTNHVYISYTNKVMLQSLIYVTQYYYTVTAGDKINEIIGTKSLAA